MANVFTVLPFLAFIAVAHPATYKAVRSVAGNWVSNAEGRATLGGLVLHALVFVVLVSVLMRLIAPNVSKYELDMADIDEIPKFDEQMASFHPSAEQGDDMSGSMAPIVSTPAPAPAPAMGANWFAALLKK